MDAEVGAVAAGLTHDRGIHQAHAQPARQRRQGGPGAQLGHHQPAQPGGGVAQPFPEGHPRERGDARLPRPQGRSAHRPAAHGIGERQMQEGGGTGNAARALQRAQLLRLALPLRGQQRQQERPLCLDHFFRVHSPRFASRWATSSPKLTPMPLVGAPTHLWRCRGTPCGHGR